MRGLSLSGSAWLEGGCKRPNPGSIPSFVKGPHAPHPCPAAAVVPSGCRHHQTAGNADDIRATEGELTSQATKKLAELDKDIAAGPGAK